MSIVISLFTTLLVFSVVATPVEERIRTSYVTLPLAKRINTSGGALQLVKHDEARAAALTGRGAVIQGNRFHHRSGTSTPVTNQAVAYVATFGVGSPPTDYSLIVDTGSSNTWVGANKPYQTTSTTTETGQLMFVQYGSGTFTGVEVVDNVNLAPGLTITHQTIGVATVAQGFQGFDGIAGLGPADLTRGSVIFQPGKTIPTVTQNLYAQGAISEEVVAIFFAPTNTESVANGELTFGGVDTTKYIGEIDYIPVTTQSPSNEYWGIEQSITYGESTILNHAAGIVDTGTTLILIDPVSYNAYKSATGAVEDSTTGLLRITNNQYSALKNLVFETTSRKFTLIPNGQIWPRSLNTYIGGDPNFIYLIVGNLGSLSSDGLKFINGLTFLERFYSVFDTTKKRVGFATTRYTEADTN